LHPIANAITAKTQTADITISVSCNRTTLNSLEEVINERERDGGEDFVKHGGAFSSIKSS
jgi:hypothetical protein